MITRDIMVGGAVLAGLLVGGVAYAATRPAPAAAAPSLSFKAGHRYEIDMVIPAGSTMTSGNAPSATAVQDNLNTIASGAFTVVSAGVSISSTASTTGGFTFWVLVDVVKAITVIQADLMAGTPAGTTLTATDEGLSSSSSAPTTSALASSGSSSSSTSAGAAAPSSTTSSSSSSSSSSTTSTAPPATVAVGTPTALATPGPPATTGWSTLITLGPGDAAVTAMPGDTITIRLPKGALWASSGSDAGFPTSGSADYVGGYTGAITVKLAWTLAGVAYSSTLAFTNGQTFDSTSAFVLRYDTVRISLAAADYQTLMAAVAASSAESAALTAAQANLIKAGINPASMTIAAAFREFLLAGGPFDLPLAINIVTLRTWAPSGSMGIPGPASATPVDGVPLPADWPKDTGAIVRAEFQYTGNGLDLSTLPYTLSAWMRVL